MPCTGPRAFAATPPPPPHVLPHTPTAQTSYLRCLPLPHHQPSAHATLLLPPPLAAFPIVFYAGMPLLLSFPWWRPTPHSSNPHTRPACTHTCPLHATPARPFTPLYHEQSWDSRVRVATQYYLQHPARTPTIGCSDLPDSLPPLPRLGPASSQPPAAPQAGGSGSSNQRALPISVLGQQQTTAAHSPTATPVVNMGRRHIPTPWHPRIVPHPPLATYLAIPFRAC